MYVRPEFRRRGIGSGLLDALLSEARRLGYRTVLLDTPRYAAEAQSRYRSVGFREVEPYPESEAFPGFVEYCCFMERAL
jgi:GNAT superfamily N-acetyltransferase